jgi:small subunit ribosomal protein S8
MSIDTVGNFLTIIRNGVQISKPFVMVPQSKMNKAIADILLTEGFIRFAQEVEQDDKKALKIGLKYVGGESAIHELKRVSKLSRRSYSGVSEIKPVIGGLGISILTTNRGVITQKNAKKLGVGGEVICTVW